MGRRVGGKEGGEGGGREPGQSHRDLGGLAHTTLLVLLLSELARRLSQLQLRIPPFVHSFRLRKQIRKQLLGRTFVDESMQLPLRLTATPSAERRLPAPSLRPFRARRTMQTLFPKPHKKPFT